MPERSSDSNPENSPGIGIGDSIALFRRACADGQFGQTELAVLGLSVRTWNALRRAGVHTVEDLACFDDESHLQREIRRISQGILDELRTVAGHWISDAGILPLVPVSVRPDPSESYGSLILPQAVLESLQRRNVSLGRISVRDLGLSRGVVNALLRAGYHTVEQLQNVPEKDLLERVRNFGTGSLSKLRSGLLDLLEGPHLDGDILAPVRDPLGWSLEISGEREAHEQGALGDSVVGFDEDEGQPSNWRIQHPVLALYVPSLLDSFRLIAAWAMAEHDQKTLASAFALATGCEELPDEIRAAWRTLTSACEPPGLPFRRRSMASVKVLSEPSIIAPTVMRALRDRSIEPALLKIRDLPLPRRVQAALRANGYTTLAEVGELSERELTGYVRGLNAVGVHHLQDVADNLAQGRTSAPSGAVLGSLEQSVLDCLAVLLAWGWDWDKHGTTSIIDVIRMAADATDLPLDVGHARDTLLAVSTVELGVPDRGRYDWWATARRVLGGLSPIEISVLQSRELSIGDRATLAELGEQQGVSRERIRQIEARALRKLTEVMETGDSQALVRASRRFRSALGAACPLESVAECWPGLLDSSFLAEKMAVESRLLLWCAGSFQVHDEWLVAAPAKVLLEKSRALLEELLANGPIRRQDILEAIGGLDIREPYREAWLQRSTEVRVLGEYVCSWTGSLGDKAAAVLEIRGAPMTRGELSAMICSDRSENSLQNSLHTDERLMRTGPEHFGLRAWGGHEYMNIVEAIRTEIERRGGEVAIETLAATLVQRFGVADTSVRIYASNPQFVRTGRGTVRIAREIGRGGPGRSIEMTKHCFRLRDGWAWRFTVTRDTLRGSGRPMPVGLAQHIGLDYGGIVTRQGPAGELRFSWPTAQGQPNIGSVRLEANALNAQEGDYLFVEIVSESAVAFHLVRRAALERLTGNERLAREVGARLEDWDADPVRMVAAALGLDDRSGDLLLAVRSRIRARDDEELLDLLPNSRGSVDEGSLTDLVDLVTWSSWD